MKIIIKLLILSILLSSYTTILFSEEIVVKENIDLKIEKKSEIKPKKDNIKLADVAKEQEDKAKKLKEDQKKLERKPKKKLTLDEKRAILAIKKQKEKDIADKKAEALYQEALKKAIESVR